MKKRNTSEILVEDAAHELGVSARTITNYIKSKEIEAIKVGKSWFINKASFDAFKQRHGFTSKAATKSITNSLGESKTSDEAATHSEHEALSDEKQKREIYPVHGLRLFQIAKETLKADLAQDLFSKERDDLQQKFSSLQLEALEFLGAGFYAFGNKSKAILYSRAREKVGGMLAIFYFYQDQNSETPQKILKIEEDLMPAFSSLIRRMERKNDNKTEYKTKKAVKKLKSETSEKDH